MDANASLITFQPIIAEGTAERPITIRGHTNEPWGSILVLGNNIGTSTVAYAHFSGGSGFQEHGITTTGMLAVHQGNAEIRNSIFENTHNDDAVNVKWGSVTIENNTIRNTFGDAVDLDSAAGTVQNNTFHSIGREAIKNGIPNGDAIDISFSAVEITNNTVDTCGDKGISIGEMSDTVVINNTIKNCVVGISVKDLSEAIIESATLIGNSIGIEAKQKKPLFGGSRAMVKNSTFENNGQNVFIDAVSQLHQD
jgi:parallel beta-helix repeat protein